MLMGLGHPGRQMLAAKQAPAMTLDFTSGVLDPRITFTRTGGASMYDATGTMVQAASGAARFDNDPNSGRFNYVRNSAINGSVPGSPGTPPTNWTITTGPAGITRTLGAVITVGGMSVLPITYAGTATASGFMSVICDVTPGSIGQVWTGSAFLQLVSGSFLRPVFIETDELVGSSGSLLSGTQVTISPTGTLTRYSATRTFNQATCGSARLQALNSQIVNGDVVNVTIYIGLPQLERGSVATAPILTSGTALGVGMLPRGLLVEEQRTNLVTNSGPLTDFIQLAGTTISAAASQAPDGTFTGVRYIEDTSAADHSRQFQFTPTANAVYTGSVFARAAGRYNLAIEFRVLANWVGGNAFAIANLQNGTIAVTGGTATATIQPAANGWYRIAITATAAAAPSGTSSLAVGLCDNSGNASYTGDGVSDGHFWGAQLEVGGFVTSYIPTTIAAVGRNADTVSMPLGSWFNQNNGTLLFEYMLPISAIPISGASQYVGDLSDNTTSNRYALRAQTTGSQSATLVVVRAAAPVVSSALFTNTALLKQKIAVAYSPTAQLADGVGAAPQSLAAALPVGPLTTLGIGMTGAGTNPLDGYITNAKYWNYTMTAAQLQNATT